MTCEQPGCTGTIEDGYCNLCGMAADSPGEAPSVATSPRETVGSVPGSGSGSLGESPVGSSDTTGSARIGSTALGSRRLSGSGSTATRRTDRSRRLRSARIGAGLTQVPPAPRVDAEQALMKDPQIPENKRTCPNCGAPVGRSNNGRPGRAEGFCPKCGKQYSFTPKLRPGDLVVNQYEVAGCLAHGGMGWIYLAKDKNVSNRWVVMKGLLNTGDADALAAAISEQQFLAQVEHPLIVEIYNFVTHEGDGYIVMEYVGGRSLKQLLKDRRRENSSSYDPLPVDQALAFIVEVLPGFQYLHDLGLIYCDFKPDNLVQVGDGLKLIDLGGVRRADDDTSAIYGTIGYQAPEVAKVGTSVASDIYTIGRTLLVLCAEFRGYQSTYQFSLPTPKVLPLLGEHDSLYRLLLKCCAPDPADRFTSADELRVQVLGVLREEVARNAEKSSGTSAASVLFESPTVASDELDWDDFPSLRADTTDAQHAYVLNLDIADPAQRLRELNQAPAFSAEVGLAMCEAALEIERYADVSDTVNHLLTADPWEWRAVWMSGLVAVRTGDWEAAKSAFNAVYGQVPGELAPKLALAYACEKGAEPEVAETLYQVCARTDANYVSAAAFGLARLKARAGDLKGAQSALDLVPTTSRGFPESRRLLAQHLRELGGSLPQLAAAVQALDGARLSEVEREQSRVSVFTSAREVIEKTRAEPTLQIGGYPATDEGMRAGLEEGYRSLARHAGTEQARIGLVDHANQIRNRTLT